MVDNFTFRDKLYERDLEYLLEQPVVENRLPLNSNKFLELVKSCVANNYRVLIDGDCDTDGILSAKIIQKMFDRIPYKNYEIAKHLEKRHTLSEAYLISIAQEGYDVVILLDSSTNDLSGITYLTDSGIRVAVIDHHKTKNVFKDYPKGSFVINPQIDKAFKTADYAELSAGAICALVADYVLQVGFNKGYNQDLYLYGYITLYSDSCNMANLFNASFVKTYKDTVNLPMLVTMFMTKWTSFNRNFVSWRMVPRLNALIRDEQFEFLDRIIYDDAELELNQDYILKYVEEVYQGSRELKNKYADMCVIDDHYKNIVVGILDLDGDMKRRNYTGPVASVLAEKYGKAAVCVIKLNSQYYAGSCRDRYGRDLQSTFEQYCYAQGHGPAFGVEIPVYSLNMVIEQVDAHSEIFTAGTDMIVVNWDNMERETTDILNEVEEMAVYNELSGNKIPEAFAAVTLNGHFSIATRGKCQYAECDGVKFVSFDYPLHIGDKVLVKPMYDGPSAKIVVRGIL